MPRTLRFSVVWLDRECEPDRWINVNPCRLPPGAILLFTLFLNFGEEPRMCKFLPMLSLYIVSKGKRYLLIVNFSLTCSLACLLACLLVCLLACLFACQLACLSAWLFTCCLLAYLLLVYLLSCLQPCLYRRLLYISTTLPYIYKLRISELFNVDIRVRTRPLLL